MSALEEKKEQIFAILGEDPGKREVRIFLKDTKGRLQAPDKYRTSAAQRTLTQLRELLGVENVV